MVLLEEYLFNIFLDKSKIYGFWGRWSKHTEIGYFPNIRIWWFVNGKFVDWMIKIFYLGHISGGLRVHPDQQHLIFALGCKVSILHLKNNKQEFLCGHTNNISALEIAASGKWV